MLDDRLTNKSPSSELSRPSQLMLTAAAFVMGGASIYTLEGLNGGEIGKIKKTVPAIPDSKNVTALGRLEPKGEVIQLSAPRMVQGSRVKQLLVREGDKVKANQVVAILDDRDRLMAALKEAKEAVKLAQANLMKVKAGAKQEDIKALKANIDRLALEKNTQIKTQKAVLNRLQLEKNMETRVQIATIDRLQAEKNREIESQRGIIASLEAQLENARLEYQNYQSFQQTGASSTSVKDSKYFSAIETIKDKLAEARANLEFIKVYKQRQIAQAQANLQRIQSYRQQQLKEAKANLERIQLFFQQLINQNKANLESFAEIRPVDVLVAQAEVNRAVATKNRAEAELKQAYVRSPQDGQIFNIHTYPGEKVSSQGIAEIGETETMYAIIEVEQNDVNKIRLGQEVEVLTDAISGKLQGFVDRIGLKLQQQNLLESNSSKNLDSQIVEVHVRLDEQSSEKAARFTNLQIQAVVEI